MNPGRSNDGPPSSSASIALALPSPYHPILVPGDSRTGILPVIPPDSDDFPSRAPRSNAATAASAASVRALSAQLVAFYFRAPAKAFFRTRVDYLAYARTIHNAHTEALTRAAAGSRTQTWLHTAWLWARSTTPGVLASAVRHEGWGIIPHQVLPPLVANVGVGAVLYTSYLHVLGRLHEGSGRATSRVYPPPSPTSTFTAGLLAGALQSVVAAPLDALQARYDHNDLLRGQEGGRPQSMWRFGAEKLREIGLRGIFAGWGLSLAKDSAGSAVFFSVFEYVKAQGYYRFVTWYYGGLGKDTVDLLATKRPTGERDASATTTLIRPHYAIEPMFLLAAGVAASFAQQLLLHPLTHFQVKHWDHLEDLDAQAQRYRASAAAAQPDGGPRTPRFRMMRAYYRAYRETLAGCAAEAAAEGTSLGRWLYRGFWWNAIRQVPSTSAGLIIFELIRRKYGFGADEVRITKDGYDILLH
ncbi:Mitochondrial carrier domain protein [Cordyceps fumosorosea ARSEF 2679]|uniref:Mitochondrial carrier domain protein n=1 Tax=Cordyceps fumosorosea (strain ARSEF 2679) TaxID=1081104 RepID=A0A167YHH1_CORFA|nr:Mitochondrial carrier domain protein [Cordyceps fumosorosea ARSEF 2679]OAA66329.1 Mitochondrial carrier domain protein [Cordyceps fumosorosea ARSEF 2679]